MFKQLALAALAICMIPGAAFAQCTHGPGDQIKGQVVSENGTPALAKDTVYLHRLPGGTAEYSNGSACTLLGFAGIKDGRQVYTADGHGHGYSQDLMVMIGSNRHFTVVHIAGMVLEVAAVN